MSVDTFGNTPNFSPSGMEHGPTGVGYDSIGFEAIQPHVTIYEPFGTQLAVEIPPEEANVRMGTATVKTGSKRSTSAPSAILWDDELS